jgi:hypothetical protein
MNPRLKSLLDDLAGRIDDDRRRQSAERFRRTLAWQEVDRPAVVISFPYPADAPFQPFPHREIFDDPEKMLFNELLSAFNLSIALDHDVGSDLPWTVRANFGTVLIASMFGCHVEQHDDNPPWIVHQPGQEIPLTRIVEIDPRDTSAGWIPRAVRTMEAYHEILAGWPELQQRIAIVQPDLQGPFDNLDLISGSGVMLDLMTDPPAVAAALAHLAEAQVYLAEYLDQWTTEPEPGYCHQHGVTLAGEILLRNDSCIMVSPEMYRDQIAPYDRRVIEARGGGALHACGRLDHLADVILDLPGVTGLDLGQPQLNEIDSIYARAHRRAISLLRVQVSPEELGSGAAFERFPTGAVLLCPAESFDQARGLVG